MDIDLLSKMVKELILDNERVVLPGLGSFVAEVVPATFSDKGYTINPPYRKLYFRSKPDQGSDLIPFYAKSNSVSEEIAEKIIVDFITELKNILFHKKTIIFPGLGRLRATKENNVFFVADEDLDIYPEGFGLEPISLKTHQATTSEVRSAVSELKSILTDSQPVADSVTDPVADKAAEPTVEPVVDSEVESVIETIAELEVETIAEPETETFTETETEPEVESESEMVIEIEDELPRAEIDVQLDEEQQEQIDVPVVEVKKRPFWKLALLILMWLLIAIVVLAGAYVLIAHLCPEWVDQFLYTQEELELLNNFYE